VKPILRELREATDRVLAATELPKGFDPDDQMIRTIVGFLNAARRLLKALAILGANGMDDTADGLARATFEIAATAGWLAKDPNHLVRLASAYQADWDGARKSWEQDHPEELFPFADDEPIAVATTPDGQPIRLPSIGKRIDAADLESFHRIYKWLSMGLTHANLAAASYGLDQKRMENLRGPRFALANFMVLRLGRQVDELCRMGWDQRLTAAEQELERVTSRLQSSGSNSA
jgi:hypothetical protein